MMVVVFRARRTEAGLGDEYESALKRMEKLATRMPGYIAHKGFVAADGERLTLVEWESPETLCAWAMHPEHVATKRPGRDRVYEQYHLQVCKAKRESRFERDADAAAE